MTTVMEVAETIIRTTIKGRSVLAISSSGERLIIRFVDGGTVEATVSNASLVADVILDLLSEF